MFGNKAKNTKCNSIHTQVGEGSVKVFLPFKCLHVYPWAEAIIRRKPNTQQGRKHNRGSEKRIIHEPRLYV